MQILKIPNYINVENRMMRLTLYTLFGVMAADGLLTQFLVTTGRGLEANPILQAWVGQDMFLAIKVSGAFLATLLLWIKYSTKPKLIYSASVVFLAFYTSIVFWNLYVFFIS